MASGEPHETPEVVPIVPTFTPQTLTIASLSAAVLFLALILLVNRKKSKSKGNALLLVGASDGGKTAILSSLVYKQTLSTLTSLQTNSAIFTLPGSGKTLRVIDVPGHPRVRDQFKEYLEETKTIAFVVDASNISRNGPVVAEHLHQVLRAILSLPPSQTLPSLVILAHKTDLLKGTSSSAATTSALAVNRVKTVLERELEKRRVSQSGGIGVEGLGAEEEKSDVGGLECGENADGTFRFDDWEGGEVTFIGTSVKAEKASLDDEKVGSEYGLTSFEEWLDENM